MTLLPRIALCDSSDYKTRWTAANKNAGQNEISHAAINLSISIAPQSSSRLQNAVATNCNGQCLNTGFAPFYPHIEVRENKK